MPLSPVTPRSTKAELMAYITSLEAELVAARREAHNLRIKLSVASAPTAPAPARTYVPSTRQLPPAFAAAREAAMKTGKPVRVGA